MSTIRALLAVSGVAAVGAAGCAQPGIVEIHEMNPPVGAQDGAVIANDSGVGPAPLPDTGIGPAPIQDAGVTPVQDTGVAQVPDTGVPTQDAGGAQDTGVADTGPAPLPPCPSGYTCQDPSAMIKALGATGGVTKASGEPVLLSCGKSGVQDCNQSNPKASCPDFVNPYCAHLTIEFPPLDTWTCAQDCKN